MPEAHKGATAPSSPPKDEDSPATPSQASALSRRESAAQAKQVEQHYWSQPQPLGSSSRTSRSDSQPLVPSRSAARPSRLHLPPEITEQIIAKSIPSLPWHTFDNGAFRQRSAALRTYAHVSSEWKALAQRELFRWPVVRGLANIRGFLEILRSEPGLASVVEGLRVYGVSKRKAAVSELHTYAHLRSDPPLGWGARSTQAFAEYIAAVLDLCSGLKQLWLCRVDGFEPRWLTHTHQLVHLKLHSIACRSDGASTNTPNLRLRALRSLSMKDVNNAWWLPVALTSTALPSLSSLAVHNPSYRWFDLRCPRTLAFLGGLDVLGLCSANLPTHPIRLPPTLTVLWSRYFWNDYEAYIPRLPLINFSTPIALRHLRLLFRPPWDPRANDTDVGALLAVVEILANHLLADDPDLRLLEAVYMPAFMEEVLALLLVKRFLGVCARRGIELIYEEGIDRVDDASVMSVDCWTKAKIARRRVLAEEAAAAAMTAAGAVG